MRNRLALELGVISERLIKTVVKQGSTRRLQTSQFQWYLPADRSVNGPTPVEIANLSSEEISRF